MSRTDNPAGGSERPFRVAQQDLEQALRETLSRQVAAPRPLAVDPAGQAVRRADRMQRRRTLAGVGLAAVAVVAVSTGMAQLNTGTARYTSPTVVFGPTTPPTTSSAPSPSTTLAGAAFPGVSLVAGSTLVVDGQLTDLGGIGPVERGLPAPAGGWLMVGTPGAAGRTLWSVARDGSSRVLLAGADAVAATPDGRRVVWREGKQLFVTTVNDGQLLPAFRTTVPESVTPVGFVGDDVLIRVHPDRPGFVLWRPDGAPFQAGADRSTLDVYGRLPDGRLVARITTGSSSRPCLALLDPARRLAPARTGCAVPPIGDGPGSVSPDGRWLLVNGSAGSGAASARTALLIELGKAFGASPTVRPVGPPATGTAAWLASHVVYPAGDGSLVRLRVDRPNDEPTTTPVPGLATGTHPVLLTTPTV